jgi:2-amino-4-hydroxy-6-hydroxymethyldihydropteridine diphosphokinase
LNAARTTSDSRVALSLGSNLGPREELILAAIGRLGSSGIFGLEALSSLYETSPVGISTTHSFINAACVGRSSASPEAFLDLCKAIERSFGRRALGASRDRTLDIDIVLFGERVVERPDLVIPHSRMRERLFVLVPLAEIAPDLPVPPDGKLVRALRDAFPAAGGVTKVSSRSSIR